MKKGEIYVCADCGLELEVIAECHDAEPDSSCCCTEQEGGDDCNISCCGKPLAKKG